MASNSYPRPDFNEGEVTDLLFERLVSSQTPDGLLGHPSMQPLVYANGVGTRVVRIRPDRLALVCGFQYDSGEEEIELSLPENTSGVTRTDLIVLRLTRSTWRVQEAYIEGVPGSGAPAPESDPGPTGLFDLPAAQVAMAHNASTLAAGTVTPLAWYIGDDGQILCTPSTRPPHRAGRMIWETDTGRMFASNGASWAVLWEDTGWITPETVTSGWSIGSTQYRRYRGEVHLRSAPQRTGSNIPANTTNTMYWLPEGFRPDKSILITTRLDTGFLALTEVHTSGAVTVRSYAPVLQSGWFVIASKANWPAT